MPPDDPRRKAHEFLKVAHLFRLGHLPTEQPHPRTRDLSRWACQDPERAIALLKDVDLAALTALVQYAGKIEELAASIEDTLRTGARVFLCGCGATGRLALTVESLWKERHGDDGRVVAFMAGGDVALVHALERFEDDGAYGARHLAELGFADGDLLIGCTEGGETPFVLGAVEQAAAASRTHPWLLFCNPESALSSRVERFRRVRENPGVRAMCLDVGPMALAGSTRMQASTVLQLALGLALLPSAEPPRRVLERYRRRVEETDFSWLAGFIEMESEVYAAGDRVTYHVRGFGITVFTDTTERAPTFSLLPFDRMKESHGQHSLCYVVLDDATTSGEAWRLLLGRAPRPLDWPDVDARTAPCYLEEFDFSVRAIEKRWRAVPESVHHPFAIARSAQSIALRFGPLSRELPIDTLPTLLQHTLLKQVLNIHSTLVMGRLGRYEGNLMLFVRPTNGKLVDRSARYVQHLLAAAGRTGHRYEDIVLKLFEELDRGALDEPVVLRTFRALNGEA